MIKSNIFIRIIKFAGIASIFLLFSAFAILPAAAFQAEGTWKLEHLYSQKISVGIVTDLYPATSEWSAEMLIRGVQFLNGYMAILYCETPSGSQSADYKAFYRLKLSSGKTQVTFSLEDENEIVLFLFQSEQGDTVFSYCDAGPQPGQVIGLTESSNKIVFRNHFGTIRQIAE